MPQNLCATIKALLSAWREPPPTREEYEQYHDAKMKAESGVFDDKAQAERYEFEAEERARIDEKQKKERD